MYKSSEVRCVYAYAWNGDNQLLGAWPGTRLTQTTQINGLSYFWINVEGADSTTQIIFNGGNGGPQTNDLAFHAGGFYNNTGYTAVETIGADEADVEYYTLQGVRVSNPTPGIYIVRRGAKTSKMVLK